MTPDLGPSVAPTNPYTLPAWLKRWVSRTKVQAMSRTPIVASANASGTARPTVLAVPCGLMLAAIEGAISASEIPTASHKCNSRRRWGLSARPALLASVVIATPLLGGAGIQWIEGSFRSITYAPLSSRAAVAMRSLVPCARPAYRPPMLDRSSFPQNCSQYLTPQIYGPGHSMRSGGPPL